MSNRDRLSGQAWLSDPATVWGSLGHEIPERRATTKHAQHVKDAARSRA